MKNIKSIFPLFFFLFLGFVPRSFSYFEIRSDFITSFLLTSSSDAMLRSYNGIYVGSFVALGAVYMFDPLHEYVTDSGYGGALRFGDKNYLEFSGGYFERRYQTSKGKGYFVALVPGFDLHKNIGFAIPIIGKKIETGSLDKRWIVDALPYISLKVRF